MPETDPKPPENPPTPPPEPPKEDGGLKDIVAVVVACVALLGFGVFVLALLFLLDLPEVRWARATLLLTGVEAVAFAGAGYLFGREVNRGRAENAEEHAESEAKRADKTEAQGQVLAEKIHKVAASSGPRMVQRETADDSDRRLQDLAELADTLFPRRRPEVR
jgi:hypothetical protein